MPLVPKGTRGNALVVPPSFPRAQGAGGLVCAAKGAPSCLIRLQIAGGFGKWLVGWFLAAFNP